MSKLLHMNFRGNECFTETSLKNYVTKSYFDKVSVFCLLTISKIDDNLTTSKNTCKINISHIDNKF